MGISPGNNKNTSKKKRTNHAQKQTDQAHADRSILGCHPTKNTFYKVRYHRTTARQGKKQATVAVAHSILKSIYHILKVDLPYRKLGANYLNSRMKNKRRKYLKKKLEKMGYNTQLHPVLA